MLNKNIKNSFFTKYVACTMLLYTITAYSMQPENQEVAQIHRCGICMDELGANPVTRLNCGHAYCTECIMTWLTNHDYCPVCRHHAVINPALYQPIAGHGLRYAYNWINYQYARLPAPARSIASTLFGLTLMTALGHQNELLGTLAHRILPTHITTRATQYFSQQNFEQSQSITTNLLQIDQILPVPSILLLSLPCLQHSRLPYEWDVASGYLGAGLAWLTFSIRHFATQQSAISIRSTMQSLLPTDNPIAITIRERTANTIMVILYRLASDFVKKLFKSPKPE